MILTRRGLYAETIFSENIQQSEKMSREVNQKTNTGISVDDNTRILDEMDRLLGEMQDTMKTIRGLLGDFEQESLVQAGLSTSPKARN
jgi:hypothetical protein